MSVNHPYATLPPQAVFGGDMRGWRNDETEHGPAEKLRPAGDVSGLYRDPCVLNGMAASLFSDFKGSSR